MFSSSHIETVGDLRGRLMRFVKIRFWEVAALTAVAAVLAIGRAGPIGSASGRPLHGASDAVALPAGSQLEPLPAVDAVIEALDRSPVVELGESHNLVEAGRFYERLARSDALASVADAFVVEFGNARYQSLMDRYVAGRRVRPSELRKVWQDTTQVGAWDAPIYRRFFAAVRAGNAERDSAGRMRVLLGDPPIDWSRIESERDIRPFLLGRERFMAHVIERDVLARGDRAVVIAGLAHVERSVGPIQNPNVTQILDRRFPDSVWVVGVHLGFPLAEWEEALSGWPIPSVGSLEGTWIGRLPKADGLAQDALDAMLYLGSPDSLHLSVPLPSVYRDDTYWRVLKDRWPLGVGGAFSARAVFAAYQDSGYPGQFSQAEIERLRAFAVCMRDHDVEAFPDPQFQYDAVGFYGPAIAGARADPDYSAAFQACSPLLAGEASPS
jgi:hypothetical protein